jgi:hypothetical protein
VDKEEAAIVGEAVRSRTWSLRRRHNPLERRMRGQRNLLEEVSRGGGEPNPLQAL